MITSGEQPFINEHFITKPYTRMNTTATLQQMQQLKLHGMAASYRGALDYGPGLVRIELVKG